MHATATDVTGDGRSSPPADDFAAAIRRAIETLSCGEAYPTVLQTAAFVGMSVRTLERRLAAAGVSHDMLVANCPFAPAGPRCVDDSVWREMTRKRRRRWLYPRRYDPRA